MNYAQVVVNTPLTIGKPNEPDRDAAESLRERAFTYSIPERLADTIALGQLVWVPFGARRVQGVIVAFSDTSPVEQTKEIEAIVDPRPFLSPIHIELARWIARTYLCPLHEALGLMLPPGVEQQTEVLLALAPDVPREHLTEKQHALVEFLARAGETKLRALPRELHSAIEPLVRRGIVVKRSVITPPQARPKRVQAVRLITDQLPPALAQSRVAARYTAIVEFLRRHENRTVWISAVYAETGCTRADLQKLETAGVVVLEEEEVWRDSLAGRIFEKVEPPTLTDEQTRVWDEIVSSFKFQVSSFKFQVSSNLKPETAQPVTFLLHGVTGSGKTEIYIRALAEIIAQGKQGIVLVPEISLTPQTIRRFGARFERIAVIHSQLSVGERYDTWRRCRDGLVDVVIGARSALFAPLPNLGLIAMDEEHDPSYKQAESPRYHAREVALELARLTGAVVILGDATPDVETYYRATRGEFVLLELPKRVVAHRSAVSGQGSGDRGQVSAVVSHPSVVSGQWTAVGGHRSAVIGQRSDVQYLELPPVEIVDMRAELKAGNRSMFSRALQREMARVLAAREQVILFLNRRGTATFILCRDCGYVFKCRRCDN
ncbi:MAG: DEAD/DEAH box helicase, partial [Anaerolineae bacterium]|nr:DEAD/DEAH box helicase [Anaerolineae bacterium]